MDCSRTDKTKGCICGRQSVPCASSPDCNGRCKQGCLLPCRSICR
ncbi:MAG: hypothetical protein IKR18_00705 [Bacteroidaceae bacterium]|nr:hypothetical protein [Bacteroidaceae bacterium]